jgi:polysaccharide deacetylase 2 family uncharacterized protein YibQ
MPEAADKPHRQAIDEARARARRREEDRARSRLRHLSLCTGVGLSCVLLGGLTGAYLAYGGLPSYPGGSEVAIPLLEDGADPGPGSRPGARVALSQVTGFALSLPDPVAPGPAQTARAERRAALGAALEALDDHGRDAPSAGREDPLDEAGEAALARLYEEPLETAAGPKPEPAEALGAGALQHTALPAPRLPEATEAGLPAWRRFAVPIADPGARPMIAVVLDDLGLNRAGTRRAIALPGPLTLSFMTYAEGLDRMAARARAAGHELMLHVPMAPRDGSYDPGPNVLSAALPAEELARRLDWGLGRFGGFVGINNHMGSRFTASPRGMAAVMTALKGRGLLFLDSLTAPSSVGAVTARRAGVPYAERDVFLDNEWRDRAAIADQFAQLEAVALRRGSAVGIGHPHRATLDVLARWLPQARARGFAIVPISAVVRQRLGIGRQYVETSG